MLHKEGSGAPLRWTGWGAPPPQALPWPLLSGALPCEDGLRVPFSLVLGNSITEEENETLTATPEVFRQ